MIKRFVGCVGGILRVREGGMRGEYCEGEGKKEESGVSVRNEMFLRLWPETDWKGDWKGDLRENH